MFTTNAKVEHARQKLHTLQGEVEVFVQNQLNLVTHQVDTHGGQQLWIFNGPTPITPLHWSLEVGDILYNFRAGLDHLVWQLILDNGGIPGRHNSFPISESEIKFQAAMKSCLSGVNPTAQATIEGFKPYKGGHTHLWKLDTLCNIDKHRHLHTTLLDTGNIQRVSGGSDHMGVILNRVIPHFGPVEQDTKLLAIPDSQVHVNFNPTFHVAFADRQPDITDLYVTQTLYGILVVIDEIFEALNSHLTSPFKPRV